MIAKTESLVFTKVKPGFFIKERILYYDCLTPKTPPLGLNRFPKRK